MAHDYDHVMSGSDCATTLTYVTMQAQLVSHRLSLLSDFASQGHSPSLAASQPGLGWYPSPSHISASLGVTGMPVTECFRVIPVLLWQSELLAYQCFRVIPVLLWQSESYQCFRVTTRPGSQVASQPASQPASQGNRQTDSQSAGQETRQSVSQPASKSGRQAAIQLASQPVSQPASLAANQAGRQPASQKIPHARTCRFLYLGRCCCTGLLREFNLIEK